MNDLHHVLRTSRNVKRLFGVLLLVATVLSAGFITVRHLTIVADGRKKEVMTTVEDVSRVIREAGIVLNPKDEFVLSTPKLEDYTKITVHRAQLITVKANGKTQEIKTAKQTVGDVMKELGYAKADYRAVPDLETPIEAGMTIHFKKPTDPETEDDLVEGRIRSGFIETSRGRIAYTQVLEMEASAYLPTDGDGECITATGIPAEHGVVAVDPDLIPLGTYLYIPGYGVALAADTGGMIEGYMIDLCMEDYWDCIEFGRQVIDVYVLDL